MTDWKSRWRSLVALVRSDAPPAAPITTGEPPPGGDAPPTEDASPTGRVADRGRLAGAARAHRSRAG